MIARKISRRSCLAAIAGILAALATVLVVAVVLSRGNRLPALDRARFDEASRRWDAKGLKDYDIQVVVQGRQPATYAVSVRDGVAVEATRNGAPLTQPRTMGTWSVPGMFGTIASDVDTVERRDEDQQIAQRPRLVIRAEFDADWGYPARYQRSELYTQNEVSWRVTHFQPMDNSTPTTRQPAPHRPR